MPLSEHFFRLLVLADSELDSQWLEATLRRDGLAVHAERVTDHPTLLAALDRDNRDGLIVVHPLASIDTGAALELVRSHDPVLPVVIVAEALDAHEVGAALRNGANDYLAKNHLARLAPALLNAISLARARRERDDAHAALRQSERRLRELYAHLDSTIERERTAIAREIHDDIGNLLTTLHLDLSWIKRNGGPASSARVAHALQSVAKIMETARRVQRGLRPAVLDAGLIPALSWQTGEFRRATGLEVAFSHHGATDRIDEGHAMALFRTLQESLTNVARHARARLVRIDLVVDVAQVSLEISDDGVGLAPQALEKSGSFGLHGLRERALQAGGWIEISNRTGAPDAGTGTCVLLMLPLAVPAMTPAEPVS